MPQTRPSHAGRPTHRTGLPGINGPARRDGSPCHERTTPHDHPHPTQADPLSSWADQAQTIQPTRRVSPALTDSPGSTVPPPRWRAHPAVGPTRHKRTCPARRVSLPRTDPPRTNVPTPRRRAPTGRVSHAQARLAGVCGPAGRELGAAKDAMAAVAFRAGSSDGGGRRGRRSLTAERGVVWQSAFFPTVHLRGKGGLLVGAGEAGLARALDRRAAYSAASASASYFWRGQKKPRSPSFRFRGTTWTCRWGTLWLTRLFSATNEPAAPSTDSIADA